MFNRTGYSVFTKERRMLNFRPLYYFRMVAKEGGFARAADRLGMAVQTISAQVHDLEQDLGHQLFKPAGRGVALTEAGQATYARAEAIFQLGQGIAEEVRAAGSAPAARLSVGLSDGISKLAAHALLEPVLATPQLRLVCHEGELDELLSELALHPLDVVLAGQAAPRNVNQRLLGECPDLSEEVHAIWSRRGQHHPLVRQIVAAAHRGGVA